MKCGAGPAPVRNQGTVGVLQKLMQAQQQDGKAAVKLIDSSNSQAAAPAAPEPGKGQLVDLRA